MQKSNPIYIPRNQRVEQVLNEVIKTGKFESFKAFIHKLSSPYPETDFDKNFMQPPAQTEEQVYKTYCGT
ncbi:hypothetical protein JZU68_08765, partial [bacterium]|nr:hypothetical protein [bacterium]